MHLFDLGSNMVVEILSWLTHTQDIINASLTCQLFYRNITNSITSIDGCNYRIIPSNWLCLFPKLASVKVHIQLLSSQDLQQLARRLVYGMFDIGKLSNYKNHLELCLEYLQHIGDWEKYYSFGTFFHANYYASIYFNTHFIWAHDDCEIFQKVIIDCPFETIIHNYFPITLPSTVKEFILVVEDFFTAPTNISCYLNIDRLAIACCNEDITHPTFNIYFYFGRTFQTYIENQEREGKIKPGQIFPRLRNLDIPLSVVNNNIIRLLMRFPGLQRLSLLACNEKEETKLKILIQNNPDIFTRLDVITIYSTRSDIRYRISNWRLPNITIQSSFPLLISDAAEKVLVG